MTYNEWRDELKKNLLSVSEQERQRVLDYYAEAYADRRDAGFSEKAVIEEFGAPYDAAKKILSDSDSEPVSPFDSGEDEKFETTEKVTADATENTQKVSDDTKDNATAESKLEKRKRERRERREARTKNIENRAESKSEPPKVTPPPQTAQTSGRGNYTWVFVLLCIIFFFPLFGLIMAMVGITIGLCAAPFGLLIAGVASIGEGIGSMVSGEGVYGLLAMGSGLMSFGASVILFALFPRLIKLMWSLFAKTIHFIKSLFGGKEFA